MTITGQLQQMNPDVSEDIVRAASRILQEQGIRHVLVGTAALKFLDKMPFGRKFTAGDVDFLVDRPPRVENALPKSAVSVNGSVAVEINKVKVDFIVTNRFSANARMRKYFTKNPQIVNGVPVAALEDILGLKASAAREKDFEFLAAWISMHGDIPRKKTFVDRLKEIFA